MSNPPFGNFRLGHYIVRCIKCKVCIEQCRCADKNKPIYEKLCEKCEEVIKVEKKTDSRWEEYCREFLKGCTIHICTDRKDRPHNCYSCTDAFVKAIQQLKKEVDEPDA